MIISTERLSQAEPAKRKARVTSNKRPSWMGIARHLTGTDLERMVNEYNRGQLHIRAPKGQALTRSAFAEVAAYLRWDGKLEGAT